MQSTTRSQKANVPRRAFNRANQAITLSAAVEVVVAPQDEWQASNADLLVTNKKGMLPTDWLSELEKLRHKLSRGGHFPCRHGQ